jgi:hypothetical protein
MDAQDDTGHTIAKSRGAEELSEWWDRGGGGGEGVGPPGC